MNKLILAVIVGSLGGVLVWFAGCDRPDDGFGYRSRGAVEIDTRKWDENREKRELSERVSELERKLNAIQEEVMCRKCGETFTTEHFNEG